MIRLFNTLHHQLEDFTPINQGKVGVYSCGPTVYWNSHIGHMYAFTIWDIMVRFLRWCGYDVKHVMNITDVGHLTSDADTGEDKMEKGAKQEHLSVWEVAKKYIDQFFYSSDLLNINRPNIVCKATDHIADMIQLIKKIEHNGYAYQISDGLYFDTSKLKNYGEMAKLDIKNQQEGARVESVPEKRNPSDFALWKFSPAKVKRQMEWESPWGIGFPGWHIECTAMSVKYLGKKFDIHTGGKEHIPIHHTNELAQAEGAFGHNTANYWLHNNWLEVKGEKMSKSLGNIYTVADLKEKGFDPLAIRYLYLNSHYRQGITFSLPSLEAGQTALNNLRSIIAALVHERQTKIGSETTYISQTKNEERQKFLENFKEAMADDLNFPKALAILWSAAKSSITSSDKLDLIYDFDEILGLKLREYVSHVGVSHGKPLPVEIQELASRRDSLRKSKKFSEADELRRQIETKGYKILDEKGKSRIIASSQISRGRF